LAKLAQIDTWLASLGDKKAVRENEANILLDEAIHKHLMVKSTKEVNKVIEETTLKVNKLS